MKIDKKIIVNALIALVVYAAVMGLVKGGVLSRQMMSLITPVCVYVMMSVSLSLVVGFLGELSLGHAAFMSIGAYTGCLFLIGNEGYPAGSGEPASGCFYWRSSRSPSGSRHWYSGSFV